MNTLKVGSPKDWLLMASVTGMGWLIFQALQLEDMDHSVSVCEERSGQHRDYS